MIVYDTEHRGLTVRRQRDGTYDVFNEKGERVSEGHGERLVAERSADRIAWKTRRRTRLCMTCQTPFPSDGAHNRMCNPCRTGAHAGDWMASASLAVSSRRRGA